MPDGDFFWTRLILLPVEPKIKAHENMTPFLDEIKRLTEELLPLKEDLKTLKKDKAEKDAIVAMFMNNLSGLLTES